MLISTNQLTEAEREALWRFCISVGTNLKAHTNCLHCELNGELIEKAFNESDDELVSRKLVSVNVDCKHIPQSILDFHNSLNPKVGFCGSLMVENCDFALTEERKKFILEHTKYAYYNGFLGGFTLSEDDNPELGIFYDDTEIRLHDKLILECVPHEYYMAVDLDDELKERFLQFEDYEERNGLILKKLDGSTAPDLTGVAATVSLTDNILTIESEDMLVTFTATPKNYEVEFNKEALGGELTVINDGDHVRAEYVGQNPTDFISGERYEILSLMFMCDCQGGDTNIKFDGVYADLLLELKTQDGKFCDIRLVSDKIFVDKNSLKR